MWGLHFLDVGVGIVIGAILAVTIPAVYTWVGKQVASAEAKAKINTTSLDARLAVLEAAAKKL